MLFQRDDEPRKAALQSGGMEFERRLPGREGQTALDASWEV